MPATDAETHSLGAVARMTGLTPELVRAWERRYRAVAPERTAGGTRRYRDADVARLRLLKSAVDSGHRIGRVANWTDSRLAAEVASTRAPLSPEISGALDAATRLDAAHLEALANAALEARGPARFAREFALPLLQTIGDRWASDAISIAGEHLTSSLLRGMMRSSLQARRPQRRRPRAIFATPSGESHELGTLAAAVVASSSGLDVTYLGPDLPAEELLRAVTMREAEAVVLGLAHLRTDAARAFVRALRAALPSDVAVWIGGAGCTELTADGVVPIPSFEALETEIGALKQADRSSA